MDDLERAVRECVQKETALPFDLDADTDLTLRAGVEGDDLDELLRVFSERFGVDMAGYRWYHHTGPEGCNPLWLIFRPWWMRAVHVPVRLRDLFEAARAKRWSIEYPAKTDQDSAHRKPRTFG